LQLPGSINYLSVDTGDYQELYLCRYYSKSDSSRFVYFSVKYSKFPGETDGPYILKCIGFGPAYLGTYGNARQAITFDSSLIFVKDKGPIFQLQKNIKEKNSSKKRKNKRSTEDIIFVLNIPVNENRDFICVSKLVLNGKNKIAGARPVVFPISKIFGLNELQFRYVNTIQLK